MEVKTYQGGCHCGAVRYEATSDLAQVMMCNCSMCHRMGWTLAFVDKDKFNLLSGEESLTDYQFNKKKIHHVFCKVCGIRSFCYGTDEAGKTAYGVNVRCLDDVDLTTLPAPMVYDGKSL